MTRGRAALFIGIVLATTAMIGCGTSAPNRDGWWDPGAHAVDGYWVTHEHPCEPQGGDTCKAAIETATSILHATEPGAMITEAVTAGYPMMRGNGPNEVSFTIGGLEEPRFVIFDLADGSRRTIALTCGPERSTDGTPTGAAACRAAEYEVWRVTGS